MSSLSRLKDRYLNSGSQHFMAVTDLNRNRMLNMLFSMAFMGGFYIALIELAFAYVLLQRDANRYIGYVLPFAAITLAYPLLVAVTVLIKNLTGSFHVTLLNNVLINFFCFGMARFLGERAQMHLIILSQFPIIFLFYRYGSWRSIAAHITIVIAGVTAILASYRVAAPLYPLPEDLADLPGYLCFAATFGMLIWYSVYNWKVVHQTEKSLQDERDQTRKLLDETIPKLAKAEAQYRHLVDDSGDVIFLADRDLHLLSMNSMAAKMLGYFPDSMIGKNLIAFIAESSESDGEINRNIVRTQVEQLLAKGKINRFRTRLKHGSRDNGVEVLLSLQLSRVNGQSEIIGRAIEVEPEIALQFLNQEKGSYTLDNSILQADILSERITDRISLQYTQQQLNAIRTGIREMLINAVEHGNLAIDFDEKTKALEQGNFMDFLKQRQKDSRFIDRKVQVRYVINRKGLIVRITDEGEGFDHQAFLKRMREDDALLTMEHGRGIAMTRTAFDSVDFNEKGNEVTLKILHFAKAKANA